MVSPRLLKYIVFLTIFIFSIRVLVVFSDVNTAYNTLLDIASKYNAVRPNIVGNVLAKSGGRQVEYITTCKWDHNISQVGDNIKVISDNPSGLAYHVVGAPFIYFKLKFNYEKNVLDPTYYPILSLHHRIRDTWEFLRVSLKINSRYQWDINYSTDFYILFQHYIFNISTNKYVLLQDDSIHANLNADLQNTIMTVYFVPTFYKYFNETENKTYLIFGFRYKLSFNDQQYVDGQLAWTKLLLAENSTVYNVYNVYKLVKDNLDKIYSWSIWIGLGYDIYREPDLPNVKDYHEVSASAGYLETQISIYDPIVYDFIIDSKMLAEKFTNGKLEEYSKELVKKDVVQLGEFSYLNPGFLVYIGVALGLAVVIGQLGRKSPRFSALFATILIFSLFYMLIPDFRLFVVLAIAFLLGVVK